MGKSLLSKAQAETARGLYAVSNGLLAVAQKILWPRRRPARAQRVCVYRIGNVGDVVCALPALFAIRQAYPEAQLTLLTSPGKRGSAGAEELLRGAAWLDRLWVYYADEVDTRQKRIDFVKRLKESHFDAWFELPNDLSAFSTSLRNMGMARWAGARWAYGWRINTLRWGAQAQSEHLRFPNEVDRLLNVVRESGISVGQTRFPLPVTERHRAAARRLLETAGIADKPLAALAPGAKRALNRWPAERFAQTGLHLAQKGFSVLIFGGASDASLGRQIADRMGSAAVNLAGKTSLLEACALLKQCRLIVTNDSGLQHLAAAVGVPCVSLFSDRDFPGKWKPYGPGHIVLQKKVECHTCHLEVCPYDNRCINLHTADEVSGCIDRLLMSKYPVNLAEEPSDGLE